MTIEKLEEILLKSYSSDTCYPKQKDDWNKNNPYLGQCKVTTLIVNDYFGGLIGKCKVDDVSHYFNIINNEIIDLTQKQFNTIPNYNNIDIIKREDMLDDNTIKRYKILKDRVLEYEKDI